MNRVVFFLVFLLSVGNSGFLMAQSHLSFGFSGVEHQDTLHIGDSIHFSFWLVNEGSVVINDSISVSCETLDGFGASISSMSIGDYYNTSSMLDVGDSLFVTITEVVSFASYALGDNIIVIWPAFIGPGIIDTSITNIHILGSVTSEEILNIPLNDVDFYPNPAKDYVVISDNSELAISGVSVYDYLGNLVYSYNDSFSDSFYLGLDGFHPGVYFVEIIIGGQRIVRRLVVIN